MKKKKIDIHINCDYNPLPIVTTVFQFAHIVFAEMYVVMDMFELWKNVMVFLHQPVVQQGLNVANLPKVTTDIVP